jgi:transcriptional regulator with XRE-family HTH domain
MNMSSIFAPIHEKIVGAMESKAITMGRTVAERIRLARMRKGMLVTELANTLGVSQPLVSRWEAGETSPMEHILDIAQALEVSPLWLLTGESPSQPRQVPLANTVREVVELSILIRQAQLEEWKGDMVDVGVDVSGDFCVTAMDDSMTERIQRGDVLICVPDARLADGAVVVLAVPDCEYPILRRVKKTADGIQFVPDRKIQGKYVDRVYTEKDGVKVLARALHIVRGKV